METFDALLRETLGVVALLALPVLGLAAIVGTAVAVVQAATQVQEQTLTALPKLLFVGGLIALFGAFGMRLCAGLLTDVVAALPRIANGP
ncbi:MAG: flagellar biosynthetic protein FliQ [Vulcanimicrobiaceae bacterium]